MHSKFHLMLAMLAGGVIGAAAVGGLHAQAQPPVYYITEIETSNLEAYVREYAPLVQASIKAAGGRSVAAGRAKSIEGDPPKTRVAIGVWESEEQLQKWRNSAEYKKAREVGDKFAKFRAFSVGGSPQ